MRRVGEHPIRPIDWAAYAICAVITLIALFFFDGGVPGGFPR